MDTKKEDESVKAENPQSTNNTPETEEVKEVVPVIETEKDFDEIVHDHSREGNIENVEGEPGTEKDVDDLMHKLPHTPAPGGMENKEQDIDDLMHRK